MKPNEYGSLCTEMYELLHPEAPADEWAFYESFARKGDRILEPLCGSGRFLIPFLKKGFSIRGVDNSGEMLGRLKEKAPRPTWCAWIWKPTGRRIPLIIF